MLDLDNLPDKGATPSGVARENVGIDINMVPDRHSDTLRDLYRQSRTKPDEFAKVRKLAEQSGLPEVTVRNQPAEAERVVQEPDWYNLEQVSPKTVEQLVKNTKLFQQASDDTENLSWWERTLNATWRPAKRGLIGSLQGFDALQVSDAFEILDAIGKIESGEFKTDADIAKGTRFSSLLMGAARTPDGLASLRQRMGKQVNENMLEYLQRAQTLRQKELQPTTGLRQLTEADSFGDGAAAIAANPSVIPELISQSLGALLPMAPAIVASGGAGGVGALAVSTGLSSMVTEYVNSFTEVFQEMGIDLADTNAARTAMASPEFAERMRAKGAKAAVIGLFDAATAGVAGTVLAPAKVGTKTLTTAQRQSINIPAQTGVQAAGGGAGEAAGSVAAGEEVRPGAVLAEMIAEAPGGVIDVAILALNRAGNDTAKAQEALEDAQRLEQLFNMAAQSKLRTRDPESFAQFVQEMAQGEGALSEVYIDAETLVDVLNQAGVEQGTFLGQMPSVAEQLQDAIATGNASVAIPVGELLGNLTGTGLEQALLPHLRTAPDALSLVEAQQASEQAQVYLQELANEVLQQANDAEAVRTSAETVKTTILDQLNTANRFTADVNETYANLVRDFYTATSARLGITPEEMYQRYPLRIRAEGMPSPETLQADGVDLRGVATPATVAEVQQMLRTYNSQSATVPISPEQRSQAEALLAPLVERANAAKAYFDAAVSRIAEQFGLAPKLAPIKGLKRAAEKLVNETENLDVTQIRDMLRATVVVPNVEDVQAAVEQIGQSFEIVRIKDRFARPTESGYRDVLINVRTPEGVEAEIQVNVPAMLSAKEAGHKLYEMARVLPEGDPRRVRLEELQSRLYAEAFDSATNASNSAALTGTPYENTLAESGNGLAPAGPTATQLPSGSLATGTPSTSNNLASGGNSNISGTSDSIISDAETSNQVVLQESIDASLNSVAAPAQATLADFTPAMLPGLLDKQGWAVLTAEDPGATKATPEQNAIAMANLRADLEDMGADFIEVTGKYGDVQRAFIVTGISEEEAQALGNKYGQESVLTRRGLIYGDGAVTPATGMEVYPSAPGDFYTEVPSTGAFFSVVLDFEATGEAFAQARRPSKLLGKPSTAAEQPAVELPQQLSETTAVDIRLGAPLTGRQGMSVAQVGLYFDGLTGPRDYNDPVEYQRALRTLITEVQFQLQQEKNGLDWYEEDIAAAFAETQTIIPELADPGQRQLFSVMAGILSPQTNARDNWFITAKAFSYYKQTGKVPGRNPETGSLWQGGTTSVNKEKALVMLDNMVQDIGEAAAIDWLMSEHTVKELNDARRQWGNMGPGVDGKMTDTALGLRAFGPKVGPFVMNINGIHEITVDMWATRTFNRYFGQMMGPDGKIVDAPTEPQRRVVKDLFNEAAEALNIKGYQVQSVIWFFEQQLFNQLGTGAQSYGFSDGARRFTGSDLGNAGNVVGGQGAGGNAQASAVLNQSSTGTVNLTGVHFSKQPRTRLDGVYYGTGLKGLEADRLAGSSDPRLKQRVYFYVDEGKGVRPEGGVGGVAHSAELTNLYDAKADPLRLWRGDLNDIESRILDAGFSGYYIRDAFNQQGAAVVLGQASRSIPAQQIANPTTQAPARQAAPQQFRRGLLAREIDSIDLPAVQAVAPSANIRAGNFVVDMAELEAARGVLAGQGVELPGGALNQTPADQLNQPARGTFSPSKMELSLLKDADLSTFLHESGHFFLEVLADIATQPGAPADVQADMAAVMKWFGVADAQTWMGMTLDQKRPHHEKFAESFEQYLFEGKAPSPELKSMFRRFREFLTSVYTSLKEFARRYNTELNDEVRGVFDRLLATDAQIREAERQAGMTPDFDATNEAIEKLSARSLRDLKWVVNARSKMLKQLQRDIDGKRKAMREQVTLEIRRRAEYAVQRFLKFGELANEDGTVEKVEGGKLSLPIMKEFYGEGPAAQWRYLPTNMVTADVDAGLHFNMVAELFGYRNGDEMVRAVLSAEPEASAIDGLTDQRLLETYGDLATPEGIERAANEAIHNEARARFVATQIKALREGMNQRERTAAGGSVNVIVRAAKEFAQNLVARRKVRDLKPGLFTAAEARAAKRGEELTMAGDTAGALTAKRDQLLNHYAAKYTMEAQSEVDKKLDYLRKFEKDSVRKKLPPEYLDQIDKLLERFDLRRGTSLRQIDKRASLLAWVENQRELGLDPAVPEELLDEATLRSYKDMTIEEFRGLVDTVRNIEHLGRLKDKLLTLQDQREFAAVVQELEASIRDNATKSREERINAPTRLDEAKDAVRAFFSMHRKLSSFVRQMDGLKDGGPFWNVLVRSMNAAADNEAVQREKATKQLSKIFEPLLKSNKLKQLAFIPAINRSLSLETRLAIAMNWGNETNRQRIMDGDKWSQQQVEAILATLTPEQLKFVQRVWDYIDSYWPDIRAKEERVSGVAPEKVQASAFTVRLLDGTEVEMAGGYYPIKYDPDRSSKAEADTAAEITKQMMQGQYTRATTRRGHTKARVDTVNRPVRKDMGVVFEHVTQVIHDLSWHEWLIDATRLLRSGPIDSAIRETMGPEVLRDMREAIKDIAAGEVPAQNQFEASINHLRNGTTIVGMGWNLMTALMQPLGLTQSMVRIGPMWVGKGIATMFGDATRMENSVRKIHEKSDFMRLRDQTLNREINEIRNKVRGEMTGPVAATYFYLIQKLQLVVDAPTWLGAYEKAIAQGADEAGAVALADQAVRDAQGAGQVSDLARIQRGSTLQKLFTNFYNYFNTTFNLTAERFNMTNFRNPLQVGRFMVDMLLLYTIPSVLATLLKEAVRGGLDDEDELAEKLIREQLNYLLGTMVGLRELGAAVNGFTGYEGPAGTRFFSEVAKLGKQVEQGELDEALLKRLNNAAGILFHYPAGAVNRAVEGYLAYTEGETDNPLAVIFGPPPKN